MNRQDAIIGQGAIIGRWAAMASVGLRLARPRVSLMVAGATLFGALLHGGGEPWSVACAVAGALCLCAGCSALNQVQERGRDALMARTRDRPLPMGRIGAGHAVQLAAVLLSVGLVLFLLAGGWLLGAVGVAVPLVYNGAYTPLKPRTSLALLVGGTVGAFPPLAGWLAAGGVPHDPRILAVMGLFYLWQTPHFWLLAAIHRHDYARAGFPLVAASLPPWACNPLMLLWIMAFFLASGALLGSMGQGMASPALLCGTLLAGAATTAFAVRGYGRVALAVVNASLVLSMAAILGLAH
ncbi:MAG: protoheme IX farnesyltransferase [Desulfovibrionaceae bacterium]